MNWLGQQRVDLPHLRLVESEVTADFDLLAGRTIAGNKARVVYGFQILGSSGSAEGLQLNVANGLLLHPLAAEHGTLFSVPALRPAETLERTNPRLSGSFSAGQVNYVGVDLVRAPDSTTSDLVQILDANTLNERPAIVPLGRTLDYRIVVSTSDFASTPSIAPVAQVVTDSNNNVTSVVDARQMLFRLGTGGSTPDAVHTYPWPGGRSEAGDNSSFTEGDRAIDSLKSWLDAAMTRMWELGGGERWYSATADRNVYMVRGGTVFSNGEYFEVVGGNLHWRGLRFVFDNSTGAFNDVADQTSNSAGLTDLADGECIYVDLDRTQDLTGGDALVARKALWSALGTPTAPGSRFIIAWRNGTSYFARDTAYPVGTTFTVATTSALGLVKINYDPFDPAAPVAVVADSSGRAVASGLTRGIAGGGTLIIGGQLNDLAVIIGKAATNTTVLGSLLVDSITKNAGVRITCSTALFATASNANDPGLKGTGDGTGAGVHGVSSAGGSAAVRGEGANNGFGGNFTGHGTAAGLQSVGGATAPGLVATGGGTNQAGGSFASGGGTGAGAAGTAVSGSGPGLLGTSEGSGPGVKGVGDDTGFGGEFIGVGGGLKVTAKNNDNPTVQVLDQGGNIRSLFDHVGYPMGRISEWYEGWRPVESISATGASTQILDFAATIVGTGSVASSTIQPPIASRVVRATNSGSSDGDLTWYYSTQICSFETFSSYVLEFEAAATALVGDETLYVGLNDDAGGSPIAANSGCWFYLGPGDTNWHAFAINAGGNSGALDTTVAATIAGSPLTFARFRIEVHGSGSPIGSIVRFYVNDSLRNTSTRVPDGFMRFFVGTKRDGGASGTGTIDVGPVKMRWNRMLAPPAL